MCKVQPYTYVEIFLVCDAVAVMDLEAVYKSSVWTLNAETTVRFCLSLPFCPICTYVA